MKELSKRCWTEINLSIIVRNYQIYKNSLPENKKIMAVVKADAYGHGAKILAKYAYEEMNVTHFAVATMIEGIELRKVLPDTKIKIIVLGYVSDSFVKEALMLHQALSLCSSMVDEEMRYEAAW